MTRLTLFFLVTTAAAAATPDVQQTVQSIGERCRGAHEYVFEGELVLSGQRGAEPGRVLSQSKVRLAIAPGGKFYLRIEAGR
jgi:hypothetical protein